MKNHPKEKSKILEIFQKNLFNKVEIFMKKGDMEGLILERILIRAPRRNEIGSIFGAAYETNRLASKSQFKEDLEDDSLRFIIKYNSLDLNYVSNIKISPEGKIISLEIHDPDFVEKEKILHNYQLFKKK